MAELGKALGAYSTFAGNTDTLLGIADNDLSQFAGGNGRYRYAKAIDMGKNSAAVLAAAPRYENTAMVMDMRALTERCPAPLFQLSLDGDWDETAWNRLRSFLYYCK